MRFIRRAVNAFRLLTSKEAGDQTNGSERYRLAFKALSGAWIAQVVTILTGVITTPLLIHYLGDERYGLMLSAVSVFVFVKYLDFGCGIGIQNGISRFFGEGEHKKANVYASSGMAFYLVLAGGLAIILSATVPHLPLERILKVNSKVAGAELLPTVLVLSVTVTLGLVATYVQRLCDSLQQGYLTRYALVFSRMVSFVLIIGGIHLGVGVPVLVTVYCLPSVASLFAYGVLMRKFPWMKPRVKSVDLSIFKEIIVIGTQGLSSNLAYSVMFSTIPLLISNRVGVAYVISFSVVNQLVSIMVMLIANISLPFWPAIVEAMARGESAWVRKAFQRFSLITTALAVFAATGLFFLGRLVIFLWTHNRAAVPSTSLLLSMALFLIMLVVYTNLSTLLNGLNRFRGQAIYGSVVAVATVATAYFAGYRLGVAGISWVYTTGFFIRCVCLAVELKMVDRRGLYGPQAV